MACSNVAGSGSAALPWKKPTQPASASWAISASLSPFRPTVSAPSGLAEKSFSWWDYRMNGFKRNLGLRIDHILLTPGLAKRCVSSTIDVDPRKQDRPSDHAPVIADIR